MSIQRRNYDLLNMGTSRQLEKHLILAAAGDLKLGQTGRNQLLNYIFFLLLPLMTETKFSRFLIGSVLISGVWNVPTSSPRPYNGVTPTVDELQTPGSS